MSNTANRSAPTPQPVPASLRSQIDEKFLLRPIAVEFQPSSGWTHAPQTVPGRTFGIRQIPASDCLLSSVDVCLVDQFHRCFRAPGFRLNLLLECCGTSAAHEARELEWELCCTNEPSLRRSVEPRRRGEC